MSERKQDSHLVGWTDDPVFSDDGKLKYWRVKLKGHELQDMIDKYLTRVSDAGGGNAYLTLFVSNSGKACCRVWDPNSEGAQEARAAKQENNVADDLPF
jgi:hypothetical protein